LLALHGCAAGSPGFAFDTDDGGADAAPWIVAATDDATAAPPPPGDEEQGLVAFELEGGGLPADDEADAGTPAPTGPPFDAGEGGICSAALAPGDLTIVELMIEATEGTGDHGEWVEVRSTLPCAVDLLGVHGECASGATVYTFQIDDDTWLPAGGSFVVADSTNAALNHDLPGTVVPWSGQPGDVLRNEGATVTLFFASTIVDSITYPKLKLTPDVSTAFPSDCPAELRSQWSAWQPSTASWFPAFFGTPNSPNADVHCVAEDGGT
jgi:hypothetical protein